MFFETIAKFDTFQFFVRYLVDIDQGIHYGKKDELFKTLQSKLAGSFYTMVLMGTFICASIKFFL